uniref:DUF1995 domain-containing protein n=1 Tax=Chlamydomonas leiostraca TaxID=1034604 RepID=A0A7S0RMB0_9CHLO|mmetsp:Transcript_26282/g.66907  ORF Transcript_26282/g.66907 Transcript_26282/m.66907 type:complete len:295 (+) Transcript_26282:90-974(+)|eukprot:CAMPEP_0202859174 /NCGR_PEP_ID=MMETSP1391-20130828/1405_1 /ASSEMBLY_ACC=CAM_ASM_000867 /TAXON_ID=1034604 /ORGANISM="Chlamydomonas leiostraca, Strain SAG 11-49" /LENGTH=294 /DNA_ID=CAMNT_0049538185 /DNA_START=89 /DNA_END=973 /DNA_ORIENTATION=-
MLHQHCQGRFHHQLKRSNAARTVIVRASSSKPAVQQAISVPTQAEAQCAQAAQAIEAAFRAGIKRQRVELLLPLIGATDLDDWPGGVRQQFKAVSPLVEQILRAVKQGEGLQGPMSAEIWDDGDAVACWRSDKMACVVFPTASTLDRLRKLAEGPDAPSLVIIVNPQWEAGGWSKGNPLSDFGIGPWRAAKEAFVATFEPTYWLRQQRVYGDVVRVLRGYPHAWQVHVDVARAPGTRANLAPASECIAVTPALPSYAEIEATLRARPSSSINKSVSQRLQEEWEFNRKSLDGPK